MLFKTVGRALAALITACGFFASAAAAPITYSAHGTGLSIDGQSMENEWWIIFMGDTDDVVRTEIPAGLFTPANDFDTVEATLGAMIEVDGVGTFNVLGAQGVFLNRAQDRLGFGAFIGGDVFVDLEFRTEVGMASLTEEIWFEDLTTVTNFGLGGIGSFATDGGTIIFDHNVPGAAFHAEFKVPEPATLALFGLGLAGLGVVRRKRVG